MARRELANKQTIKEAHRKMMLMNHPDRGGSPFIASKINEAAEVLQARRCSIDLSNHHPCLSASLGSEALPQTLPSQREGRPAACTWSRSPCRSCHSTSPAAQGQRKSSGSAFS